MSANFEEAGYIQVLEEKVADLDTCMENISGYMSDISDNASAITSVLCHGSWKGDARQKCLEAYNTLFSYYHKIDDCYRDLATAITDLVSDADEFKGNSQEVAKLL